LMLVVVFTLFWLVIFSREERDKIATLLRGYLRR
jgi:hypothetical protein